MADNRMRMVQSNIDALANQPRVPEARAPPTHGNDDIRMHVDDIVARILGEHGRQSSAFGQHMSGLSGEMVRNLQEQNSHLSDRLRRLAQPPHPLANCAR